MKKNPQPATPAKSRRSKGGKLTLTPEIQALYFQCLAGKLPQLSPEDQGILLALFHQQFPSLRKEAQRYTKLQAPAFLQTIVRWIFYGMLVVLGFLLILIMLEYQARAEVVDEVLIQEALQQAEASMRRAWTQGTESDRQPIHAVVGENGTLALAQNAPKRIITRPDGALDISDSHTTITILRQPTPVPPPPPQETRIQTTVNGVDQIETRAMLPESLDTDQLNAVKQIADNGALIAQQRFQLAQYQIDTNRELETLRIVKSFILWGFLASIPFLLTSYWIFKHLLSGYRDLKQDELTYKQQELESVERQLAMSGLSQRGGGDV